MKAGLPGSVSEAPLNIPAEGSVSPMTSRTRVCGPSLHRGEAVGKGNMRRIVVQSV